MANINFGFEHHARKLYSGAIEQGIQNTLVPMVIETSGRGERAFDIFSRLLRERIIFLGSGIDEHVAGLVMAQLIFLESEDPERDIYIYVNSPGGSVSAGLGIYDTPHSRIMIHQPSGGAQGQETDIIIQAREIEKIRKLLEELLAKHTGRDVLQIREDSERDRWMNASEALEYGIIDQIFEKRPAPEKAD